MAISDITKATVLAHKNVLKSQLQALKAQKQEHQAAIAALNLRVDSLQAEIAALTADIPEPIAVEP